MAAVSSKPGCKNEDSCQGVAEEMDSQNGQEPSRGDRFRISQVQDR